MPILCAKVGNEGGHYLNFKSTSSCFIPFPYRLDGNIFHFAALETERGQTHFSLMTQNVISVWMTWIYLFFSI